MILVIGATGTVGSRTLAALKARGARVRVGLRTPAKAAALGVEGVPFDFENPSTYLPALQGAESVFLVPPTGDQSRATARLVEAATQAGVKRLVKLSVAGAGMPQPPLAFARFHKASEDIIASSKLAWTFLRPTFFMQNFATYYGVKAGEDCTVYLPNAEGKVSWLDVRDIADVAAETLTKEGHVGKAYELTGGEALTTGEACAALSKATGNKITYVPVPEEAARDAMLKQGMPADAVTGLLELNALIRAGHAASIASGVKDVLGREPRTFATFAADFARGVA